MWKRSVQDSCLWEVEQVTQSTLLLLAAQQWKAYYTEQLWPAYYFQSSTIHYWPSTYSSPFSNAPLIVQLLHYQYIYKTRGWQVCFEPSFLNVAFAFACLVFYDCHKNRGICAFDHPRLVFIVAKNFSGMWIVMRSGKGSTCKACKKIFWEKTWRKLLTYNSNQFKETLFARFAQHFFLLRGITLCTTSSERSHVIPIMLAIFSSWRKIPMMDWHKGNVTRKWLPLDNTIIIILTKCSAELLLQDKKVDHSSKASFVLVNHARQRIPFMRTPSRPGLASSTLLESRVVDAAMVMRLMEFNGPLKSHEFPFFDI